MTDLASPEQRWDQLCEIYLPIKGKDFSWRYSRETRPSDPEQGWKLHISATVLTATTLFEKIAPFLNSHAALYKGPATLDEIHKLNSGLFFGYSQIGKLFTVYPVNEDEFRFLAQSLHELTNGLSAPAVPFDRRLSEGSCVFYRYGAFDLLELENPDGSRVPAIRSPDGSLIPDDRNSPAPPWAIPPIPFEQTIRDDTSPLRTTYKVFGVLSQRGKGGVYEAIDLSTLPPRLCILKEGRRHGEPDWQGRDGAVRVKSEELILNTLHNLNIGVPKVYASFELEDNYYLVSEYVKGVTLESLLGERKRRLPIVQVVKLGVKIAEILFRIHSNGWIWRDCKPGNLVVTIDGELRPVDFEGATRTGTVDSAAWSTPIYYPLETYDGVSSESSDLYAYGCVLYFLLTGTLPKAKEISPVEKLRRNVPRKLRELVTDLLSDEPERRPKALITLARLAEFQQVTGSGSIGVRKADSEDRNGDCHKTAQP